MAKMAQRKKQGVKRGSAQHLDYMKNRRANLMLDAHVKFEQQLLESQEVLHELWGFSEKRNKQFEDALRAKHKEYARFVVEDNKADSDIEYTKEVMERIDKRVNGKNAKSFEERFNMEDI